jgi:hypothetical protein
LATRGISVLLLSLLVLSCGSEAAGPESEEAVSARDDSIAHEVSPASVAADPTPVAAEQDPGPDATLTVNPVPEGWEFSHQARPETAHKNSVILQFFFGGSAGVEIPGGGEGQLMLVVNAAHVPGLQETGQDEDLAALAGPSGGWTLEDELTVNHRRTVVLTADGAPVPSRMLILTIGDWCIQITGAGIPEDTLAMFAEAVNVA